jgi:hypothetical protein
MSFIARHNSLRKGELGPLAKIGKRLLNGPEDNVRHYFRVVWNEWNAV